MKHKTIFITLYILIVINIISCNREILEYSEFTEQLHVGISEGDYQKVMMLSEKINDDNILKEDGFKFFKLKIASLTICGEYENAYEVFSNYEEEFNNNFEFLMAQGLIFEKLHKDGLVYFGKALTILDNLPLDDKNEDIKVIMYYLTLLTSIKNRIGIQDELYDSFNLETKIVADHYKELSFDELLLSSPISFVSPSKSLFSNEELGNKKNGGK